MLKHIILKFSKTTVCVIIAVAYLLMFQYQFWFKEQNTIFIYTKYFFVSMVSLPGGLSAYVGSFMTQFSKILFWGGSSIVAIFALLWIIYSKILRKCFQINGLFLAFYPVMYLLVLFSFVNYNFSIICAHLVVSLVFYIYINIQNHYLRYATGLLTIFLLYWSTNTFFFTGAALFIMFELCCKQQKYYLIVSALYLFVSLPIPELSYRLFLLPYEECYFSRYWIMETLIVARDVELIYPSMGIFPAVFLIAFANKYISVERLFWVKSIHVLMCITMFIGLFVIWSNRQHETRSLKSLHLLRNEKWNEIIENVHKTEKPIFVEMMLYNFALAHEHSYPRKLLFDPRNSINFYRDEQLRGILKPSFTSELYFHLGFVNKAFYEFFNVKKSLDPYTGAYSLKRMAQIQLLKGNYSLSEKYYTILSKTMLYSRDARERLNLISNAELIEQNVEINKKRKLMEHDNFFWGEQILANLVNYIETNVSNRLAFEYLTGFILLAADLQHLMRYLAPLVENYYKYNIPDIYQQAALSCFSEIYPIELENWNISDRNRKLYSEFLLDKNSVNFTSEMLRKYENTYFHYLITR